MLTDSVVLDVVLLDSGPDCRVYETTIEGHNVVFEVTADASAWDVARAALQALEEEKLVSLAELLDVEITPNSTVRTKREICERIRAASVRDEISRRIF